MPPDELRRINRVNVCCRVDVRDHFGAWIAVTEDLCSLGCRIVTGRLPRVGSLLELALWSDLFPQRLEVLAEVAWASPGRVGATFLPTPRRPGALSPAEFVAKVVEHGRLPGNPEREGGGPRLAPCVIHQSGATAAPLVLFPRPRLAPVVDPPEPQLRARDG